MRKVVPFIEWQLQESNVEITEKVLQRYIDTVIFYCLRSFSVDGGNVEADKSRDAAIAERPDLLGGTNGPDIWVNCGDFEGKIEDELYAVLKLWHIKKESDRVKQEFAKYGMEISTLSEDEVIVNIDLPYSVLTYNLEYVKKNAEAIIKFYEKTQPEGLKELGEELKIQFKAKEYGI